MAYWLLKTEPEAYSFGDLQLAGTDRWDGVRNNAALKHLRNIKAGDQAFIYHTGGERAVVAVADVVSDPYPDPDQGDDRYVVVDVRARRPLPRPVTLSEIKNSMAFRDWDLVKNSRLSVMPVHEEYWRLVLEMSMGNPR